MGNLKQLSQRLSSLRGELNQILSDVINKEEPTILDLNREQLFFRSQRSDGNLMPQYEPVTIDRKEQLGIKPIKDQYNLSWEGDLYGGMQVEANKKTMLIYTTDWKNAIYDKMENYGGGASPFGLQDKSKVELKERITPDIHNRILKHLKRK